jgi:hypothetical protein
MLEFDVEVTCDGKMDYDQLMGPLVGCYDPTADLTANYGGAGNKADRIACLPKIVFSQGDAFSKAQTSYNVTVNGAQISNHNQNLYLGSLAQCWISPESYQLRFSQCGGKPNAYDSVPVSGQAAAVGAVGAVKVYGYTGDSGVDQRAKNFYGCIRANMTPPAATSQDKVTVRCQVPIWGAGLFNPFSSSDALSQTCPLTKSMYALAHMNSFSVEMLFEDLEQQLIRCISSASLADGGGRIFANSSTTNAIQCRIVGDQVGDRKPQLLTEWIRLPSWRQIPSTITASTYKITTHRATKQDPGDDVVVFAQTRAGVPAQTSCLPSVGRARNQAVDGARAGRSAPLALGTSAFIDATFSAVQSAQIPSYLFFCMQKSSKMFTQEGFFAKQASGWGAVAAGAAVAADTSRQSAGLQNYMYSRNQDANAQIADFELMIQSSIGAYVYSSDTYPYVRRQRELWTDHLKNVCEGYCGSDMLTWQKNNSCLLIRASDFARGLGSPNSAMPVQITAKCKFINAREQIDGHAACALERHGVAVLRDFIAGVPCMAQIFDSNALTIASSSAVASSANLSHSTALDILSRQ